MAFSALERFKSRAVNSSSRRSSEGDGNDGNTSGTSITSASSSSTPTVLASAPQPSKILQDVLDCIQTLKNLFDEDGNPIDDNNQTLHRFCAKLEYLLQAELKDKKTITGKRKDYWEYFCECLGPLKGVNDGIKYVKTTGDCKTSLGKGRAFLRFCLMHHRLADSLQACGTNGKVTSGWYSTKTIWLQHDKSTMLISALYDLNDIIFDLAPRGYDLDNSWPSFARKNNEGQHTWSLSERARTMSISSLNSIGPETPVKGQLSSTPNDSGMDHLAQELAISENVRSDLEDKMEALAQQKGIFQQNVAESRGEVNMLETQLRELQAEYKQLQTNNRELEKKYDKLCMETEYKTREDKTQESVLETKITKLETENDKLQQKIVQIEEDLQLTQENLQITSDERDTGRKTIEDLNEKVDVLSQEIENQKSSMSEKMSTVEEEKVALLEKLKSMEESEVEANRTLSDAQVELNEGKIETEQLRKKMTALSSGYQWLNNLRNGAAFVEITDLDSSSLLTLQDLSHFINGLKDKLIQGEKDKDNMSTQLHNVSSSNAELQQEIFQRKEEIIALNNVVSKLKESEEQMMQKITILEHSFEGDKEKMNEVQDIVGAKDKELTELKSVVSSLELENGQINKTIEERNKNLLDIKQELERSKDEQNKASETVAVAMKTGQEYMQKVKKLEVELKEKDVTLNEYRDKEKELQLTLKSVDRDSELHATRFAEKEKETKRLENEIEKLRIENSSLEELCKSLKSEKDLLNAETKKQHAKVTDLELKDNKLQEKLAEKKKKYLSVSSEFEKFKNEQHSKEVELTLERDSLAKDLENMKNVNMNNEREIASMKEKQEHFQNLVTKGNDSESKLSTKLEQVEKELNTMSLSLVSVEKDLGASNKEKVQLTDENKSLKLEIKQFQDQCYEKQSEVLLLQEKVQRSQEDIERSELLHDSAVKTESEWSERLSFLENNLTTKDSKITELTQIEKTLTVENSKLNRDKLELEQCLDKLQNDMDYLKKGFNGKESQIEELRVLVGEAGIEKSSLQRQLDDLSAQLETKKSEIFVLGNDLDIRTDEKNKLEQTIFEINANLTEAGKEIRLYEQKLFDMEQKRHELSDTIEQMQKDFDEATEEKEKLEANVSDLEQESQQNKKQIEELRNDIDQVQKNKEMMQLSMLEKEEDFNETRSQFEKLKVDFDVLSKDKYELEEKMDIRENEIHQLSINLEDSQTGKDELEAAKSNLELSLKQMEESNQRYCEEIKTVGEKINEVEKVDLSLNEQIAHLTELCKELEEKEQDLEGKFQKVCDDNLVLQEKEANNVDSIKKLEEHIQKSELEKDSIQGHLSLKCVELNELQARFDDFQSENACLVQEYDLLQQTFNDLKETEEVVRSKLTEMTASRDEVASQHKILHEQLQKSQTHLQKLENGMEELMKDKESLSNNLEAKIKCCVDIEAKKNDLENQLMEVTSGRDKTDVQLQDASSEIDRRKSEEASLLIQIEELKQRVNSKQNEVELVEDKLLDVETKYQKEREDKAKLIVDLDTKAFELKNSHELKDSLESDLQEYKCQAEDLKESENSLINRLEEAETNSVSLELSIKEMTDQITEMEKECTVLKDSVKIIESDKKQLIEELKSNVLDKEGLQTKASDGSTVIAELQNEIEKVRKQASEESSALTKEIGSIRKTEQNINEELNKRTEENGVLRSQLDSMQAESCMISDQNQRVQHENDELQNIKQSLHTKCSDLQSNISEHENNLMKERQERKTIETGLRKEITDLQKTKNELEVTLSTAVTDLKDREEDIHVCSGDLESVLEEKNFLEKKIAELDIMNKDLEQELETVKENVQTKVLQLQSQLDEKELRIGELENMKETAELDFENKMKSLRDENTDMGSKIEQFTDEVNGLRRSIVEKEDMIKETKSEVEKANVQTENSGQSIQSLQSEMVTLDEQLKENNALVSSQTELIDQLREENTAMKEELNCFDSKIAENDHAVSILKEEISEKTGQIGTLNEEIDQMRKERQNLEEKDNSLMTELTDSSSRCQEFEDLLSTKQNENELLQTSLAQFQDDIKELEEKLLAKEKEIENFTHDTDRKAQDSEAEVDSLRQEIAALEFQLSSIQLDAEENQKSGTNKSDFDEMKDKVMEQEEIIEQLQQEMTELREVANKNRQLEQTLDKLQVEIKNKAAENKSITEQIEKLQSDLKEEMKSSLVVKHTFDDQKNKTEELLHEKEAEMEQLKEDAGELKKKLVKLIKEKDTLWQKTDRLTFQQRLQASEKWMDDSQVTHCIGCNSEFSFTMRKHHCRLCGRIFCHNCSSNWVLTASSSKKSRACTACFISYNEALKEDHNDDINTDIEQSVELPSRRVLGKTNPSSDTLNISTISSSMASSDEESMVDSGTSGTTSNNLTNDVSDAAPDLGATGGNETDEDKLKDSAVGTKSNLSDESGDNEEDIFHVVSDEEIQNSMTMSMSGDQEPEAPLDPNMSSSMCVSLEELLRGEVNSKNEVWIKAGRSYLVPIKIDKPNTVFGWEFTSYPKDVVFSVNYRSTFAVSFNDGQTLVPPCKCDSHKQTVKGELTAKQPGIYSLLFDNSYSRLTAKRINYTLLSDAPLVD